MALHLINSLTDSNTQPQRVPTARRFSCKCNTKLKITSNSKNPSLTQTISEVITLNDLSPSAINPD
jgi:hypothetical protein